MLITTVRPRPTYLVQYRPTARQEQPSVNVLENETAFQIQLAVPGWKKSDLSIELEKEMLVVAARPLEKNEETAMFQRQEFKPRTFKKHFQLPKNVDVEQITATATDGVLNITLPKRAKEQQAKPRTIEVS